MSFMLIGIVRRSYKLIPSVTLYYVQCFAISLYFVDLNYKGLSFQLEALICIDFS